MMRRHHKPLPKVDLEGYATHPDPAQLAELAHAAASLLVYGNTDGAPAAADDADRAARDDEATARFVHLSDEIGLEAIAEIWATAPAVSLPGVLWRLYALREWIVRSPRRAAEEYTTGRNVSRADGLGGRIRVDAYLAELVAGIEDPPGPDEVARAADEILAGAFRGDFTMALLRAAAFAEVAAAGRWELGRRDDSRAFEQLATDLASSARSHRANELA
ncbi:MAG: hypothetical protein ACTH0M_11795 [Brevibacterium yomogidense]